MLTKTKRALALTTLIALPFLGSAQDEFSSILEPANKSFKKGEYAKALRSYEAVLNMDPNNKTALENGGIAHLMAGSASEGLVYLKKAAGQGVNNADFGFWLGRAYQLNEKGDSALIYYRLFEANTGKRDKKLAAQVKTYVDEVHGAQSYFISPGENKLVVENPGALFNSAYTEANPVMSSDGKVLFFSSRRPEGNETMQADGEYSIKTWYAVRNEQGEWQKASSLPMKADVSFPLGMVNGGNKVAVYLENAGKGSIYTVQIANGIPTQTEHLADVSVSLAKGASITADASKIYYTTTNAKGNTDIALLQRDGSKWNEIALTGINTDGNEANPALTADGSTLYYSSTGGKGLGGADAFTAATTNGKDFTAATNMGAPVNSAANDIAVITETVYDLPTTVFASMRSNGQGRADIYLAAPKVSYNLTGRVVSRSGKAGAALKMVARTPGEAEVVALTGPTGDFVLPLIRGKVYEIAIKQQVNVKNDDFFTVYKQPLAWGTKTLNIVADLNDENLPAQATGLLLESK